MHASRESQGEKCHWIPASAGMTKNGFFRRFGIVKNGYEVQAFTLIVQILH
jgi:hypothetical protein